RRTLRMATTGQAMPFRPAQRSCSTWISWASSDPRVTIEGRERLSIRGPAGVLEAIAHEAEGAAQPLYGIVCHPHPLYGGTMDNKVVYTVARALQTSGVATLRFNFRGVGASAGSYDEGAGETQDAAAVADLRAAGWAHPRLILAG